MAGFVPRNYIDSLYFVDTLDYGRRRSSSTPNGRIDGWTNIVNSRKQDRDKYGGSTKFSMQAVAPDFSNGDFLPGLPNASSQQKRRSDSHRPLPLRAYSNDEEIYHRGGSISGQAATKTKTWEDSMNEPSPASDWRKSRHLGGVSQQQKEDKSQNTSRRSGMVLSRDLSQGLLPDTDHSGLGKHSASKHIGSREARNDDSRKSSKRSLSPGAEKPYRQPRRPASARKMLKLMNTTRGRMHGNLYYRKPGQSWNLSHCSIDMENGALVRVLMIDKGDNHVIPRLRGLKVQALWDHRSRATVLLVKYQDPYHEGKTDQIHLRPKHRSQFDNWFAALLCWQPVHSRQYLSGGARRQHPVPLTWPIDDGKTNMTIESSHSEGKEPPIIKVGKFWMLGRVQNENYFSSNTVEGALDASAVHPTGRSWWTRVSAILRENGELQVYSSTDHSNIAATIQLSQLTRNAIQRLHRSVFDYDYCLVVCPQYACSDEACSQLRPIVVSFDSRVLYEVWFTLFRAFSIPELYGPERPNSADSLRTDEILPGLSPEISPSLFRLEKSLYVRVGEVRLNETENEARKSVDVKGLENDPPNHGPSEGKPSQKDDIYVQIRVDGHIKAKTSLKTGTRGLFWYESFDILDTPPLASYLTVQVRRHEPHEGNGDSLAIPTRSREASIACPLIGDPSVNEHDYFFGEATIDLAEVEQSREKDQWFSLLDDTGQNVGDISLKTRVEREVILMDSEYQQLSEQLHNFANAVTIQMVERVPSELAKLSENLLNIYQVSGQACDWLMSLAEEEIDGVRGELPAGRMRFQRVDSNDNKDFLPSYGPTNDREGIVRDLGKSATSEVNLLFRGNTLLSKAVDLYMKRLGGAYLEETLGPKLREIAQKDEDCEVDPSRITSPANLSKNWKRLVNVTQDIWGLIYNSSAKCPRELRVVLRHIRACADDRYGDYLRSVVYSSVSGFLFLRFFCPAVLNPALFGLIVNDNAKLRAKRTFTLVAKSLQGLANMSTFGAKEPWMEPMNHFLTSHRQEFKSFIDAICNVPTGQPHSAVSPSYSTPLAIMTRLPPASREGFPSLPYLIDPGRSFASLIELWLDAYSNDHLVSTHTFEAALLDFHNICLKLRQRETDVYKNAERAEKRSSSLAQKWLAIAERMEMIPENYWVKSTDLENGENDDDDDGDDSKQTGRGQQDDDDKADAQRPGFRARAASSPLNPKNLKADVSDSRPGSRAESPKPGSEGTDSDGDVSKKLKKERKKKEEKERFRLFKKKQDSLGQNGDGDELDEASIPKTTTRGPTYTAFDYHKGVR